MHFTKRGLIWEIENKKFISNFQTVYHIGCIIMEL